MILYNTFPLINCYFQPRLEWFSLFKAEWEKQRNWNHFAGLAQLSGNEYVFFVFFFFGENNVLLEFMPRIHSPKKRHYKGTLTQQVIFFFSREARRTSIHYSEYTFPSSYPRWQQKVTKYLLTTRVIRFFKAFYIWVITPNNHKLSANR